MSKLFATLLIMLERSTQLFR